MKNRDYKNFAVDGIYHVYNRGVNKEKVFYNSDDFSLFLYRLKENLFPESGKHKKSWLEKRRKTLPPNSFDLISYCLMPNHFHLLIQQKTDLPITKLISKVSTSYSMCFNKKHGRIGAVFQDQFKAVLVENNEQLLWTSYYIHKNPVEAGLIKNPQDYRWSSYSEYFGVHGNFDLCKKEIITNQFHSENEYLKFFEDQEDENMVSFQDLFFDFEED
jgi:putative transposase